MNDTPAGPGKTLLIRLVPTGRAFPLTPQQAYQVAYRRFAARQFKIAEYVLEQLASAMPNAARVQMMQIAVWMELFNYAKARPVVDTMLAKHPENEQVLAAAANLYWRLNQMDKAIDLARQLVARAPDNSRFQLLLGHILAGQRNREQAIAAYLRAIECDPLQAEAYWVISRLTKGEMLADRLPAMQQALDKLQAPVPRALIHYALAGVYEPSDIDQEFAHLRQANDILAAAQPWRRESVANMNEQIISLFSRDFLDQHAGCGSDPLRVVMIVGMPRSGSTLIEQILSSHSAVEAYGERAAVTTALNDHFFRGGTVQDWKDKPATCAAALADGYRQQLDLENDQVVVTDKTLTNYSFVGFMKLAFPQAKVIHCARHPLDTFLSCYQTYFPRGLEFTRDLSHLVVAYRQHVQLMDHWKSVFADSVLTVEYERLVESGEVELRRILAFCDLPWEESCNRFYESNRTVRTFSQFQVNQPLHNRSVGRWKKYARHLQPAAEALGIDVKPFL
jgi:tetratricopeptide (TPR) repeat protein